MSERTRVLIVGAGGHGKVVADCLLSIPEAARILAPVGYLDDSEHLIGQKMLGLPVLGKIDHAEKFEHDAMVIAIGNNDLRRRLYDSFVESGESLITSTHVSAIVGRETEIGRGCMLCAQVIVNPGTIVGKNVILNSGAIVEHDCRIGDHVHIAPGVTLGGEVEIGRGTLVGLGATILRHVKIGKDCIIGAGAVVTKDILDTSVVAGIPARNFGH